MKMNNSIIILAPVFILILLTVACSFQQSEVTKQDVAEMRNNPSKYEGKSVRIVGWLKRGCGFAGLSWIENDHGYIFIMDPNWIESDVFVHDIQKDDLFEKFRNTCTDDATFIPCKKSIEIELEGFVKEIKEALEERDQDAAIEGILIVTRVIRIEEKYRKPHSEMCIEETSEEIPEKYRLVPNPAIVALSFLQPEIIQPSTSEMKNNPSKYQGKLIRLTGWLKGYARSIEDDEDYIPIIKIEPDVFVHKDSLFEKLWTTNADPYLYPPPCHKDIEVEVEGFVKRNKEAISSVRPDGKGEIGILVVTRVIRIEEKYRTPPTGVCIEETPEEIFEKYLSAPLPDIDHLIPKSNLNIDLEIIPLKTIPEPPRR